MPCSTPGIGPHSFAAKARKDATPYFDDATSLNRLREGFERVRRNKGCAGGDGMSIGVFAYGLERRLAWLREDLRSGHYAPGPLARFRIKKKNSPGKRVLSVPCVRDRVAQSAAYFAIRALAEAEFEDASFGYREGRSVAQAVDRVMAHHRAGFTWVVDADIKAYFDNVPHHGLLAAFAGLVPETPFIELIGKWLETSRFAGRGLPQGAPISPLLANLYLDHIDEVIAQAGFRIVRYADDFVILCRSEARAAKARALAAKLLAELGLEFHPDKTAIVPLDEGYRFLGKDIRHTTLARQLGEVEADSESIDIPPEPDSNSFKPERLDGSLVVPASRFMLGKTHAPENAIPPDDLKRLDHPWEPRKKDNTLYLAEGDEPPIAEAGVSPALSAVSRHAPFIRPLHLMGKGRRLDVYQSGLGIFDREHVLAVILPGTIDRIDIHPGAEVSTDAIRMAARQHVPLFLVNQRGVTQSAFHPEPMERASLHLAQARHALDETLGVTLARRFVTGRIYNQRRLIQRLRNRLSGQEKTRRDQNGLKGIIKKLDYYWRKVERDPKIDEIDVVRGFEASAAKLYWPALASLVRRGMDEENFRRIRLPADTPFNTLLNWTASLLRRDIETLLLRRNVHPGFGVLHTVNNARYGCVFDLIEEFRAPVAEALAAQLLSQGRLGARHFEQFERDGKINVWLVNGGAQKTVRAYEAFVDKEVKNPATGNFTNWRGVMDFQLTAYINHVLGYKPYEPYRMDM